MKKQWPKKSEGEGVYIYKEYRWGWRGGWVGHKMIDFIAENEIRVSENIVFLAETEASEIVFLCFSMKNAFRFSKSIVFPMKTQWSEMVCLCFSMKYAT